MIIYSEINQDVDSSMGDNLSVILQYPADKCGLSRGRP